MSERTSAYGRFTRTKRLTILIGRVELMMRQLADAKTRGRHRALTEDGLHAMEWAIDLAERDIVEHPADANLEHVGNLMDAYRASLADFRLSKVLPAERATP